MPRVLAALGVLVVLTVGVGGCSRPPSSPEQGSVERTDTSAKRTDSASLPATASPKQVVSRYLELVRSGRSAEASSLVLPGFGEGWSCQLDPPSDVKVTVSRSEPLDLAKAELFASDHTSAQMQMLLASGSEAVEFTVGWHSYVPGEGVRFVGLWRSSATEPWRIIAVSGAPLRQ